MYAAGGYKWTRGEGERGERLGHGYTTGVGSQRHVKRQQVGMWTEKSMLRYKPTQV